MDFSFFVRGLLIGLSIAAPVGPIGVLCIQRTLARGRVYGLISGMGAATADGCYGFIAGFGLTVISNVLVNQQAVIHLIGGLFLIYLGTRTLLARPAERTATTMEGNRVSAYASTLFLTLTNPLTILSFAAIFAGVGLGGASRSYLSAAILVLGVFLGSALWWFLLSGGVSLLRTKFNSRMLRGVNIVSGLIIVTFGLLALLSLMI
jgi:threonine/homoserine/homoserine lactone efflux protein